MVIDLSYGVPEGILFPEFFVSFLGAKSPQNLSKFGIDSAPPLAKSYTPAISENRLQTKNIRLIIYHVVFKICMHPQLPKLVFITKRVYYLLLKDMYFHDWKQIGGKYLTENNWQYRFPRFLNRKSSWSHVNFISPPWSQGPHESSIRDLLLSSFLSFIKLG